MFAVRLLPILLIAGVALPAFSASEIVFNEIVYEQVLAFGENNERDVNAGACDFIDGCFDRNGNNCSDDPNATCELHTVPAGRCSVGTSTSVWPQLAGTCVDPNTFGYFVRDDFFIATDPFDPDVACQNNPQCLEKTPRNTQVAPSNRPCLSDQYVADLQATLDANGDLTAVPNPNTNGPSVMCPNNGTCDMSTNSNAANCQGSNPAGAKWEGAVCGVLQSARCSDGDPTLDIGGLGTALCADLQIGSLNITSATNCGNNAGTKPLPKSPRNAFENPFRLFTGQRKPGTGFLGTGPIRRFRNTGLVKVQDPNDAINNTLGVRRLELIPETAWNDSVFSASQANGALDNIILSTRCNPPENWQSQLPVEGNCSGDPSIFCVRNTPDCAGNGTCVNKFYCLETKDPNSPELGPALGSLSFLWMRDIDPNEPIPAGLPDVYRETPGGASTWSTSNHTCPPRCGTAYDRTTFEQEEVDRIGLLDRASGIQLAFDLLGGPDEAGEGDFLTIDATTTVAWVNSAFSNPPTGDLRCVIGGQPDRADPNDLNVGTCANPDGNGSFVTCNPGDNGGLCAAGNPCLTCGGTHTSQDAKGNGRALPVGYDDKGIPALELISNGRLGVRSGFDTTVNVSLFVVGTTGNAAAEFIDDTTADGGRQVLGQCDPVSCGAIGVGTGGNCAATCAGFCANPGAGSACTTDDDCGGGETCYNGCFDIGDRFAHGGTQNAKDPNTAAAIPVCWHAEDKPAVGANPFVRIGSFGVGANGFPGCIGDNNGESSAAQACNQRLGRGLNSNGQWGLCNGSYDPNNPPFAGLNPPPNAPVFMNTNDPPVLCETTNNPLSELDFRSSYCWEAGTSKSLSNMEKCVECTGCFPVNTGSDDPERLLVVEGPGVVEGTAARFKVPNPAAVAPTLHASGATTIRDLNVIEDNSTDVIVKTNVTSCPVDPNSGVFSCAVVGGGCLDSDSDGICDDGDSSGDPNDNPCTGGNTSNCDDNCRWRVNADQADSGGLGSGSPADGIGDKCQCGDVNGNGNITSGDGTIIKRDTIGLPPGLAEPGNCDVNGNGTCTSGDGTIVKRATIGLPPGVKQECPNALPPAKP